MLPSEKTAGKEDFPPAQISSQNKEINVIVAPFAETRIIVLFVVFGPVNPAQSNCFIWGSGYEADPGFSDEIQFPKLVRDVCNETSLFLTDEQILEIEVAFLGRAKRQLAPGLIDCLKNLKKLGYKLGNEFPTEKKDHHLPKVSDY